MPSSYIPSFLRSAVSGSRPIQLTFSDVSDTNILSTSSFIYDTPNTPLKSTQQLSVDWSKFENHTFFMSAEAKVNLALEQIINGFPFDGSRIDVEKFFENLTGYDKYIFDKITKFHGQLLFSGSLLTEPQSTAGSYIVVKDFAGALYPELSKNKSGLSVLNPRDTSLSIEMQLFLPKQTNDTQVICQKLLNDNYGFSLYLMPSVSSDYVEARFSVVSGSSHMTTQAELIKGKFNHICVTLNRETKEHYLQFFKDAVSENVTTKSNTLINNMNIDNVDFLIGSGSKITLGPVSYTPTQTLSASIDEFRVFHSARTEKQQLIFSKKSLFSTPDLKLYYRFNEPPPPISFPWSGDPTYKPIQYDSVNSIVIDHSGNSLHSLISNFSKHLQFNVSGSVTSSLRQDASLDPFSQMIFEKDESCPVLFPAYPPTVEFVSALLASASIYDQANPNLITRLVPQHYFLEGAHYEGFNNEIESKGANFAGNGIPGQGTVGNAQLLLSLLYIWARFFDEIKLYVDSFSLMKTIDYDSNKSMPSNFLYDIINQFGFYLPPLFADSTLEQYIRAENIGEDITTNSSPLKYVQNELLRRVLINLPDVIKSKGTQHSIKAFLRAVGVDPDNSVRIREYGGPTSRPLSYSREEKREISTMVDFANTSLAISPFLSGSRTEVGWPYPASTSPFVQKSLYPPHGISSLTQDGLLTSGSWTVEAIVRYKREQLSNPTQSLIRMCVTGSSTANSMSTGVVANLLLISSSTPQLTLYVRSGENPFVGYLALTLPIPPSIFDDGEKFNVSFGRYRNDDPALLKITKTLQPSSSYFLRFANQSEGKINVYKTTSSFFYEISIPGGGINGLDVYKNITANGNSTSGTFLAVGSNQTIQTGTNNSYIYLNNTSKTPTEASTVNFDGRMSNLRFWSKALSEDEWKEHVRNYKSLGVSNPLLNYNFNKTSTGSFERVRLDTFAKQDTRIANSAGDIPFLDFSLNKNHMSGSGFPTNTNSVIGELFDLSYISPYFDEAASNEKIRIRSFLNQDLVDATPWATVAPVYEIVKSEQPTDDVRFSIDFSLIDALNRDIVTMFATLNAIDNALGNPELMFSPDYPDLTRLRDIYFNRIQEKLNFDAFFQFYRWFDTSIGVFIQQLVPRKTRFKGVNFVIESHMLERHKLEYLYNEIYLGEADRNRIRDVLLVQQIAGALRKY